MTGRMPNMWRACVVLLLVVAFGARRIRLVTHLDVDRAACEQAASVLQAVLREAAA